MGGNRLGKRSKDEIEKRRQMVKSLYLEGRNAASIARTLGIHRNTAQKDVAYWQERFQVNPLERFKEIKGGIKEASLDELPIIKKELWTIYRIVKDERSTQGRKLTLLILKAIGYCCDRELTEYAKVLKAANSAGISMERFKEILAELKSIVEDFVPKEKRAEVYQRLRDAKLEEMASCEQKAKD